MKISPQAIPDYTQLNNLLAAQRWKEADDETAKILLRIANREEEGWLDSQSIAMFPCAELQRIDQLWMEYSQGRFGFTVQKNIWIECGGRIDYETECLLGEQVGWYADGSGWLLVSEENLIYNLTAPPGHLPMLWPSAEHGILFRWIQRVEVMHSALAARILACSSNRLQEQQSPQQQNSQAESSDTLREEQTRPMPNSHEVSQSQNPVTLVEAEQNRTSQLNRFKERFAESPMEVFDDPTINLSTLEENSEFFADLCNKCPSKILGNEHLPIHWQIWMANHPYKGLRQEISCNPYLPKENMVILARDEYYMVRNAIAHNRNTPQEILSALAMDEERGVRLYVAGHTNAPSDALVSLATDEDWCIRSYVAKNLNTPTDVLIQLAKDEDWRVRDDVAENPNTPVEILIQLIEDTHNSVKMAVTANPNLPINLLINLADSEDDCLRSGVANNPNTPSEVLVKLANDSDSSVLDRLAKNPNTPDSILRRLATSEDSGVRIQVAQNINAPSDALVQLAQDDNEVILSCVVEHLNTPQDALTIALTKLAKDVDFRARFDAAKNVATPRDLIAELLNDIHPDVSFYASVNPNTPDHDGLMAKLIELAEGSSSQREWVATHPSLPPHILSRLAADIDSNVRLQVTINLNTPIDTLIKLADDKNSKVRLSVAVNPDIPSSLSHQLLNNLANDKDSWVRLCVANFSITPVDILVKLTQDEHSEVRREAVKNLNTPRQLPSD